MVDLRKYGNFESEAKLEQIIAIVTTRIVFLFLFKLSHSPRFQTIKVFLLS